MFILIITSGDGIKQMRFHVRDSSFSAHIRMQRLENVLAQFHCFGPTTNIEVAECGHSGTGITMSCHVLDTLRGQPARDLRVRIDKQENGAWQLVHEGSTNQDGRISNFPDNLQEGIYRAVFATGDYFQQTGVEKYFYPVVEMAFITRGGEHFHIPLLLSPFGYTTYRGS